MSFLPAESRAALDDLENLVDAKIVRLKQGASLETTRFRQALFIKWCNQKSVPDPRGAEPGYERIVACLLKTSCLIVILVQQQFKVMLRVLISVCFEKLPYPSRPQG